MAACAALLSGCGSAGEPEQPPLTTRAGLELRVQPGMGAEPVLVAVRQLPRVPGSRLTALQGRVHFDPSALRYLGQVRSDSAIVIVEASAEGEGALRFAAFAPGGLPDETVVLAFASRGLTDPGLVSYQSEATATLDGSRQRKRGVRLSGRPGNVAVRGPAERLTLDDWKRMVGARPADVPRPPRLAGEGRVYGDADLSGTPDINDALLIAQVSVQTAPLLADPLTDVAVAGNVDPANLPGLGEAADAVPPGREVDGSFLINILDALDIANFTVALPAGVVGQAIPGREVRTGVDTLPAVLAADLDLDGVKVHRLVGRVIVPRGVTLRIAAGARLEAAPAGPVSESGQLVIRQGGRLEVRGTRLQPVVMTCNAPTPAPGCWRGVVVNGGALLNNDGVSGNEFGCPILQAPDGAGIYGGCLVQDNSGLIRYLRIEYAGRAPADPVPGAALAFNGVGSGTIVDSIQVYGSAATGVAVSGGRVRVRNLVISRSVGSGLRWADGWQGKIQELIIRHDGSTGMPAIEGANFGPNPDAGPRSAPSLWNLTISGSETGGGSRPVGIQLDRGTAAIIQNAVVTGFGTGLDIDGAASCARTSDSLVVASSIFHLNTQDGDTDADCVDEGAFLTGSLPPNRFVDPEITALFVTSFDLRPLPAGAAATGSMPPGDGFFDPTMMYTGGVAPANLTRSNVPWYAGWIRQTDGQLLAAQGAPPAGTAHPGASR